MKLRYLPRYLLLCMLSMLPACGILPDRAEQAGFTKRTIDTGPFILTTFYKTGSDHDSILVVYIEGDGHAFDGKHRRSSDPTPKSPVALELAARDPHPAVLYIARPCQYLSRKQLKKCSPKYWSTHRYAEEVVAAIDQTISRSAPDYQEIALVGYSGGGTIAALIAARRRDVKWLITIAANLDHRVWTDLHKVSPLTGSLNASDYAPAIQDIPQWHLIGDRDSIVPATITRTFLNKMSKTSNVKLITVPEFDHQCCWVRDWPGLLCNSDDSFSAYCGNGQSANGR